MAVAFAVSLKLVPHGTLGAASAGMLSIDGRCKTLDARANGYARSEGVGALIVQVLDGELPVSSCAALAGSAVRQDGRSASLTAPNGSAQRTLLRVAVARAALSPDNVDTVEAHGTGTALGDPTEAGALVAAQSERTSILSVGAAKGNLGHSEAVSGQVGLLKMVGLLTSASATGNAQLLVLNPLVGERVQGLASRLAMPTQGVASDGEVGGVSSFGFSGTIAHVLLRHVSKGSLVVSPLAYHRRAFTWHVGGARDGTKRASMYSVCWPAAPGAFASSARSVLLCRRAVPSEHGPVSLCGIIL